LTFVETAIELCDGRPSDVERQGSGVRRRTILSMERDSDSDRRELICAGSWCEHRSMNAVMCENSTHGLTRPRGSRT
jgi:hypothetical protein